MHTDRAPANHVDGEQAHEQKKTAPAKRREAQHRHTRAHLTTEPSAVTCMPRRQATFRASCISVYVYYICV